MVAILLFIAIVSIEILLVLRSDSNCVVSFGENVFGEGMEHVTPNGYKFCAYTSIPYALPPIGNYRFEPPKPIPFWKGKKRFTKEANICVQMSYETLEVVGSENCLFLNVYKLINRNETNKESDLMPVMLWIHGGSYNLGSAGSDTNGPDYIVEKAIVVVTINYRLGPLGFLSWPHDNIVANIGLHDQKLAMQWVYDNIGNFGGNPKKITLSGWSAGGASVSFHLYASNSRNLFDKAIIMSGNMLHPWAFQPDVVRCTYKLLKNLNIQNGTSVIDELRAINAYDLIPPSFSDDMKIEFFGVQQFCFIPTLDDEFAPYLPHIITQLKPASAVPILIGQTSLESEWHASFQTNNIVFPNQNHSIPELINNFMIDFFGGNDDDITKKERFKQSLQRTADMTYGIHKFIKCYTNVTKQKKVFLYRFAFDGEFGHFKRNTITTDTSGATHGDDLGYLFKDFLYQNTAKYNKMNLKSEILTRERMVTMWTNFIKFGNPIPNSTELFNITWHSFNNKNKIFLNIDTNITLEQLDDNDSAYTIWESIYECLYNVECEELNKYLFNNKSIVL